MAGKTRDRTVRSRKNASLTEIPKPQSMPQMRTNGRNDTTHHAMPSHIGHHGMEHPYNLLEQLANKVQNQHVPPHSYPTTSTRMEKLVPPQGDQRPTKDKRSDRKTRRHRLVVLPSWSCRQIFRIVYGRPLSFRKITQQRPPMAIQPHNPTLGSAISNVGTQKRDRTQRHNSSQTTPTGCATYTGYRGTGNGMPIPTTNR